MFQATLSSDESEQSDSVSSSSVSARGGRSDSDSVVESLSASELSESMSVSGGGSDSDAVVLGEN